MSAAATRSAPPPTVPVAPERGAVRGRGLDQLRARLGAVVDPPRRRERAFADALRTIAAVTRTGQSLGVALREAGDRTRSVSRRVSRACARASGAIALGGPAPRAIDTLAADVDLPTAHLFAQVVAVHHRRGGDLGVLCHRLSRLLHERARLDREARALTAQARFTARAVLALPAISILLWLWRSPRTLLDLISPGTMVLVSPSVVLIVVGVLAVRSLALRATELDPSVRRDASADARRASIVTRLLTRVAGTGSIASRCARCALLGVAPLATFGALAHGAPPAALLSGTISIVCASAWPMLSDRRERQELVDVADDGVAALLEVSIALLAAGATPHEVLLAAVDGCPGRLGALLRPAAAQVRLGRAPESALGALPVVASSAELDAWLHALTAGARHGAPASDTLETLLRDARSAERERFRTRAATMGPRIQLAVVLLIVPALMWLVLVATTTGLVHQLERAGVMG